MVVMTNGSKAAPGANEQFESLGRGCYAFSADGCSNTGVVIGERGVLVIDGQATPAMAERVVARIRELTDKPVKSLVLTHFHADNTLGAAAYEAGEVIASDLTRRMMETRGAEDILVSRERDPRLFSDLPANAETSMPSMTIASSMTIDLGGLDVRLMHLGRAHTMGDLVVWVPEAGVIYAGDLVQKSAIPYCGDAHLADWPRALDRIPAFRPTTLVPGRGRIAEGAQAVTTAVETTRDYVTTLRDAAAACVEQSLGLKDTYLAVKDALSSRFAAKDDFEFHLPLNVARAYDEALGLDQPQVWTRERLADLRDALDGAAGVAVETVSEETIEAPTETVDAVEDTPAEAPGEASENEAADLVSDSDFAASLALEPEEGQAEDEVSLDLSEEDIVKEDGNSEPSPEGAEQDRKVLEEAR